MNNTYELSRTTVNQGMSRIALAVAILVVMIGLSAATTSAAPAPKAVSASLLRQSVDFHLGAADEDIFPVLAAVGGRRDFPSPVRTESLQIGNENRVSPNVAGDLLPGLAVCGAK
jgi:hypothetical protein